MKNYIILGASIIIGLALHGYITRETYQISSTSEKAAYRVNLHTGQMVHISDTTGFVVFGLED